MQITETLLLALALAMDATAVSLAVVASGRSHGNRATFRLAFHFGLFQFFMPVIGWFAGKNLVDFIASVDHWIAFGLLGFIGTRMVWSGLKGKSERFRTDPSRGFTLLLLSFATSIDALAVGFSLAMISVPIWKPAFIIGIITSLLSFFAIFVGRKAGKNAGRLMEILGGLLLIAIGLKILITHLTA